MVGYFYLINPSKCYQVHKNPTIHLLDIKYGHYRSDTLKPMQALQFSSQHSQLH
jgi:hypothetical protein